VLPYADIRQTHSAVVFFAGDLAYKLKKPVNLGFLDFSTPAAREAACRRETELNRRFAPDVYLGVAQVTGPPGCGREHLVVMRRMPDGRRLSALIRDRVPVAGPLRQVARILATQHAASPHRPEIGEQGSASALHGRWTASYEQVRTLAGRVLQARDLDAAQRLTDRFLAGRAELLSARISAGRIVDGHGDLLADDIFCLHDGPRILDCLEFDDRLRWLDGLDDAAFLAMDLERLGEPALAEQFTRWYLEFSGDPAPTALRHHYVAYRAFVRAKVACIQAGQGDPHAAAQARQLTAMTLQHLRAGAVTLVLIGGLPATGKSVIAGALADRLGWSVLNSDRIRKELAGVSPGQRSAAGYGSGIYAPEWTERTYGELVSRAARLLAMGESVVLDASWLSARQRDAALAVAAAASADPVQLRCVAPARLTAERMSHRAGGISDADPEVAARMAAAQEPWPAAIIIDTSADEPITAAAAAGRPADGALAGPVRLALEAVRPHGPDNVWRPVRPYLLPG
jgi:aminoglycoside phosphotransferase family enzyme/predicted kinase